MELLKHGNQCQNHIKERNNIEYLDHLTVESDSPNALDKLLENEKIRKINKAITKMNITLTKSS